MESTTKAQLIAKLEKRGILQAAADNGWATGDWRIYEGDTRLALPGWYQSMYTPQGDLLMNPERQKPVMGWKNYDSAASPHDTWLNYIPGFKPLMLPKKGIVRAVGIAKGTLNLTEGKADTLSMWAAGVPNAIGIFGSSFVPDDFATQLTEWEVTLLRFFSHPDEAGRKSAQRVVNLLMESDIQVEIHELPLVDDHKMDVNDLWIATEFDSASLRDHLRQLPIVTLKPEPVKVWTPTVKNRPEGLTDDRIHAYGRAVMRRIISDLLMVSNSRNNALNDAALKIGHWIAAGAIDRTEAENELYDAGRSIGLPDREIKGTVASGLKKGEQQPADLSRLEDEGKAARPAPVEKTQINVVSSEQGAERVETRRAEPKKGNKRVDVVEWGAATVDLNNMLTGCTDDGGSVILPMPFASIAALGGLAEMFLPGKMYAFVADSGKGKTSLIETMVDAWRQMGASGVIWGPEWTPVEYVMRAVQRLGGPSLMAINKHAIWHTARNNGISDANNPGTRMSAQMVEQARQISRRISTWTGKLYFVNNLDINVSEMVDAMDVACDTAEAQGTPISFAIADYAQLLNAPGSTGTERFMAAMAGFKGFCTRPQRKLIGIVGSQITKADGRAAADGEEITHHAMSGGRSDYFNLVGAIARRNRPDGSMESEALFYVSKNSIGRTGNASLIQDPVTAAWRSAETVHVDLTK